MNKVANFFKGIGDFVDALGQENREDVNNDENASNEYDVHTHGVHDALSKASSKVAKFITKTVGGAVEEFFDKKKSQEPSIEKQQQIISDSKAQVSDQDIKASGPMSLIWHIVTTVVKYVCLTCMYIILSHAKLINNPRLYV